MASFPEELKECIEPGDWQSGAAITNNPSSVRVVAQVMGDFDLVRVVGRPSSINTFQEEPVEGLGYLF